MFQLAAVAPLSMVDHQRVLASVAPGELLKVLAELTTDEVGFLAQRLAGK